MPLPYLILPFQARFSCFLVNPIQVVPGGTKVDDINLRLATCQMFQNSIMEEDKLGLQKNEEERKVGGRRLSGVHLQHGLLLHNVKGVTSSYLCGLE